MFFTLTKKILYRNALLLFTAVLFFSCQKELSIDNGTGSLPPDLKTKISSSVSGFVTDENNAAVMGATVQFGSSATVTDKFGYFEAKNVQVVKNAAFVTVSKPGYFKGIKTYIAKEGKSAFFRIKLIPKTIVGNINGTSGGSVTLTNGLSIALPAGAVVNAATNVAYTGTVNVAAFWINPEAADLNKIMPGDLRGIDKDGSLKLLQTFGMAAVELTGASGELLQITAGKKATLTLAIPSSLSATAPASIPLWYFDESNGLWKEEGNATKTGNTYVGDVSHFSFWSYSLPGPYVQFDCTLKDVAGNPIPNVFVQIQLAGTFNQGHGHTDASGFVSGLVTANAQLVFYVSPTFGCGAPIYSQTFTTTNANISLGVITISSNFMATISGTITDCNNNPVTNGDILMSSSWGFHRYAVTNTGAFSYSVILCNSNPVPITFIAEDQAAQQQSALYNTSIVVGLNNIGNLQACNISNAEFINYSIDGTNYSITVPPDTLNYYPVFPNNVPHMIINGGQIVGSNTAYIYVDWSAVTLNSLQPLAAFGLAQMPNVSFQNPINVHITEYGIIGEFVSGNFTGVFTDNAPPNATHNVTCSFRIRRLF